MTVNSVLSCYSPLCVGALSLVLVCDFVLCLLSYSTIISLSKTELIAFFPLCVCLSLVVSWVGL